MCKQKEINLEEVLKNFFVYCYKISIYDESENTELSEIEKECICDLCLQQGQNGAYVIFDNVLKSWIYERFSTLFSDENPVSHFSVSDYLDPSFFDAVKSSLESFFNEIKKEFPAETIGRIIDVLKSSRSYLEYNFSSLLAQDRNINIKITNKTKSVNEDIDKLIQDVTPIKEDVDAIKHKTIEVKRKLEKQQQESTESSLTILGIFVGVVMVFFGGFSILTEAITTMNSVTPYRLIFTMLGFAIIMYNSVMMLFFLIGKITGKAIRNECYEYVLSSNSKVCDKADENCGSSANKNNIKAEEENDKEKKRNINCVTCSNKAICSGIRKLKNLYPYIYWGNIIILALLTFIFAMWIYFKMFGETGNILTSSIIGFIVSVLFLLLAFFISKKKKIRVKKQSNPQNIQEARK